MGFELDGWRTSVLGIAPAVAPDMVDAFLALLDGSPSPARRDQMEPGHLTASAFVVAPDGTGLLLIDHVALGLWLQPGGHVEADASPMAAAAREAVEETGVTLAAGEVIDLDVHHIPPRPSRGEAAHRHYDVRVAFRAIGWALDASADGGVRAARWVTWAELDAVNTDASVRRTAVRLRAWALSADRLRPPG